MSLIQSALEKAGKATGATVTQVKKKKVEEKPSPIRIQKQQILRETEELEEKIAAIQPALPHTQKTKSKSTAESLKQWIPVALCLWALALAAAYFYSTDFNFKLSFNRLSQPQNSTPLPSPSGRGQGEGITQNQPPQPNLLPQRERRDSDSAPLPAPVVEAPKPQPKIENVVAAPVEMASKIIQAQVAPKPKEVDRSIGIPEFKLTGITFIEQNPVAVVNNQVVGIGDSLRERAQVKDIQRRSVILDYQGQEVTLRF